MRGRRAAGLLRQAMHDLGLEPDIVLVSSARRTQETLALLEPWNETPLIESLDALYLASPDQLLATLRGVAETARSVMVVGHNPGLHELALSLIGPAVLTEGDAAYRDPVAGIAKGFPSGALAEFSVLGPWSRLGEGGGRLVRFLTPRGLEGTG